MAYADMFGVYVDTDTRNRINMCASEQAQTPLGAGTTLGDKVLAGDMAAIDSIIRAVASGPNSANLANDADVLSAVQSVWPAVDAALAGTP